MIRWWKKNERTLQSLFLKILKNLSNKRFTLSFLNHCLIIAESCFDLSKNKNLWKQKQYRETFRFLKSYHLRRRNYKKKPKECLIITLYCFTIDQWSERTRIFQMINQKEHSLRRSSSSVQRFYKEHLKKLKFHDLKKKWTDCFEQMLLISLNDVNTMKKDCKSILSWKNVL